ncbi:hypothetical protein D3Z36_05390 [Lachnospiraceae bacterium]|nr:hypothetical protein [Lachnospiraceae bacterium]
MTGLLEIRERLRDIVGKYEIYFIAGVKFVLGLVTFFLINSQMGYMERLTHPAVALLLALVCTFLPVNVMAFFAIALVLLHLSALSLEVCVIGLCLFLLLFFLYGKFAAHNGYLVILTPILCFFKVPQVMPVASGLMREPISYLSLVCGVVTYYFIEGVEQNIANFTSVEESESTTKFTAALKILMGNREMYLVSAAFLITSLVVYIIRRKSMNYAWRVALFMGNLVQIVILLTGYVLLGMPEVILWVILGSLGSVAVSLILEFFFYNLDYSRVERVQFEDDEYYYFVKAVPKVYVAKKDKRVKQITPRKKTTVNRRKLAEELDIDQDMLD